MDLRHNPQWSISTLEFVQWSAERMNINTKNHLVGCFNRFEKVLVKFGKGLASAASEMTMAWKKLVGNWPAICSFKYVYHTNIHRDWNMNTTKVSTYSEIKLDTSQKKQMWQRSENGRMVHAKLLHPFHFGIPDSKNLLEMENGPASFDLWAAVNSCDVIGNKRSRFLKNNTWEPGVSYISPLCDHVAALGSMTVSCNAPASMRLQCSGQLVELLPIQNMCPWWSWNIKNRWVLACPPDSLHRNWKIHRLHVSNLEI